MSFRIPGRYSGYSPGINIMVGWTNLSAIQVTRYLCASCGFIEAWVDSADDIAKVKKKVCFLNGVVRIVLATCSLDTMRSIWICIFDADPE